MVTYLFDKSALSRVGRSEKVDEAFEHLAMNGRLATCAIIDLEIGYRARSLVEFDSIDRDRQALYQELAITSTVARRARDVQRELVRRGKHRGPGASDLLIAACAETHGAVVVHYDKDFETIAAITNQKVRWIVKQGSAD